LWDLGHVIAKFNTIVLQKARKRVLLSVP